VSATTNDGFALDALSPEDFEDLSVDLGPDARPARAGKSCRDELIAESLRQMRAVTQEHREAAKAARAALARLVTACSHRGGQSKRVRALLYSLWNGAPRSVLDGLSGIDWAIKRDLCAVMLGFGWDGDKQVPAFHYDQLKDAFALAGEWDWFLQEAPEDDDDVIGNPGGES
jgi:hypothetical protein